MLTTVLDLLGIGLLAAFAWFLWWPLTLLVLGVAALAISRQAVSR